MREVSIKLATLIVLLSFNSAIGKVDTINNPEDPKALTITRMMVKEKKKEKKRW